MFTNIFNTTNLSVYNQFFPFSHTISRDVEPSIDNRSTVNEAANFRGEKLRVTCEKIGRVTSRGKIISSGGHLHFYLLVDSPPRFILKESPRFADNLGGRGENSFLSPVFSSHPRSWNTVTR